VTDPRGVDVEQDRLGVVLGVEVQHQGDDVVGEVVGDFLTEEDNALLTQARVDVDPALVGAAGKTVGNARYTDGHGFEGGRGIGRKQGETIECDGAIGADRG
jgi:hypothetical protein